MECTELLLRLGDDEVLVIDLRDREAWDELMLHIPGAMRLSLSELTQSADSLPDDELIVLCGFEPDGADSRRAARLLRLRGRAPEVLDGGLREWIQAGYPTERHASPAHEGWTVAR